MSENNYLLWAQSTLGIEINPNIIVEELGPDRGLKNIGTIGDNPLIYVPFSSLLTVESATETPFASISNSRIREDDILSLVLLFERFERGPSSKWSNHIDYLPLEYHSIPNYSINELNMIVGTNLHQIALKWKPQIESDFLELTKYVLPDSNLSIGEQYSEWLTYPNYLWALSSIWSRFITIDRKGRQLRAMVPVVDLLNHHPKATLGHRFDADQDLFQIISATLPPIFSSSSSSSPSSSPLSSSLRLSSNEDDPFSPPSPPPTTTLPPSLPLLLPSDPLLLNYGHVNNERLLMLYGFSLLDNPYSSVEIWAKHMMETNNTTTTTPASSSPSPSTSSNYSLKRKALDLIQIYDQSKPFTLDLKPTSTTTTTTPTIHTTTTPTTTTTTPTIHTTTTPTTTTTIHTTPTTTTIPLTPPSSSSSSSSPSSSSPSFLCYLPRSFLTFLRIQRWSTNTIPKTPFSFSSLSSLSSLSSSSTPPPPTPTPLRPATPIERLQFFVRAKENPLSLENEREVCEVMREIIERKLSSYDENKPSKRNTSTSSSSSSSSCSSFFSSKLNDFSQSFSEDIEKLRGIGGLKYENKEMEELDLILQGKNKFSVSISKDHSSSIIHEESLLLSSINSSISQEPHEQAHHSTFIPSTQREANSLCLVISEKRVLLCALRALEEHSAMLCF